MIIKAFDGSKIYTERLKRTPRKSILRAGHIIGILPDGRELVKFGDEWYWLLRGASREEIALVDELLKKSDSK